MAAERSPVGLVPLIAAVLAVAGPVYAVARWVTVWDAGQRREAVLARFMAGFPSWLPSPHAVSVASLLACAVAVGCALLARRRLSRGSRRLAGAVLGLAVLLGAWNLLP